MSRTTEIITSQERKKCFKVVVFGKICGFHSPVMEKSGFLKCDFVLLDKWFLTFPRNVRGHFTSHAASHPKILEYWLKFFCTDFKTNRRKNLCIIRFSFAKVWKTTITLVMSLCLYVCLSVSDCLSVWLTHSLSVCPTVCLYVRLFVCVAPSVHPFIRMNNSASTGRIFIKDYI